MTISMLKARDAITPALKAKLKKAQNPQKALEAMGLAVVSIARRAFTAEQFRPAGWAALKPATIQAKKKAGRSEKPLQRTGTLAKSPRVMAVTRTTVTVGSDRKAGAHSLAAIHQLGTKDGRIPARPFFPFDKQGRPTARARKNILAAATAATAALKLDRK